MFISDSRELVPMEELDDVERLLGMWGAEGDTLQGKCLSAQHQPHSKSNHQFSSFLKLRSEIRIRKQYKTESMHGQGKHY